MVNPLIVKVMEAHEILSSVMRNEGFNELDFRQQYCIRQAIIILGETPAPEI